MKYQIKTAGCLIVAAVMLFILFVPIHPWPKIIAQRARASNCVSALAKTQNSLMFVRHDGPVIIRSSECGGTVTGYAVQFAKRVGMNTPELWFIWSDPALESVERKPLQVANLSDPKNPVADPDFVKAGPKSWAVVVDMPDPKTLEARSATYPVMWTRGLSGTRWTEKSPWQGKGGHVAYLDGHVAWYESTLGADGKGVFKDFITGEPTADIRKAIGPGATILEDE